MQRYFDGLRARLEPIVRAQAWLVLPAMVPLCLVVGLVLLVTHRVVKGPQMRRPTETFIVKKIRNENSVEETVHPPTPTREALHLGVPVQVRNDSPLQETVVVKKEANFEERSLDEDQSSFNETSPSKDQSLVDESVTVEDRAPSEERAGVEKTEQVLEVTDFRDSVTLREPDSTSEMAEAEPEVSLGVTEEKQQQMHREATILDLNTAGPLRSSGTAEYGSDVGRNVRCAVGVLSCAGHTGGRASMEDACCLLCVNTTGGGVFDGAGGSRAAELAARSVRDFYAKLEQPDASEGTLRECLAATEHATLAAARMAKWPDATTAVVAVCDMDVIRVAWVGDSVALLVSKSGGFELLSDPPHVASTPSEARRVKLAGGRVGRSETEAGASKARKLVGKLSPAAAFGARKNNPKRVYPGGITLTRALGGLPLKYSSGPQLVVSQPDLASRNRSANDLAIVLASDGLLERLEPSRVVHLLNTCLPNEAAHKLVEAAIQENTVDNVACVCIYFDN
ncbi:MAG: PP2C family protein-serine/threonine phosphatase [Pseudomonadota bacterium]